MNTKICLRGLLGIALLFIGLIKSDPASAQTTCSQFGTVSINGGQYTYQQDEWNSSLQQCASVSGVGFTLTSANFNTATNGAPATYPSLYRGCHWGSCTSSNPFPIQLSNLGSASTSVSITQPSGYANDSAYDIWFNQSSTTSGQPNGTEIMVWINHQGAPQPAGSQIATATINGASWQVWAGTGNGGGTSWNIVSYVLVSPVKSVSNMDLIPFFNDSVSRGKLQSSWWLIGVEFGFEIWTGGQGLAVTNFSVSAAAKSSSSSSSSSSSRSSSSSSSSSSSGSSCHVTYSITNQWNGGFQSAITINNTGGTAINGWTLTWTFANGQTITSLWNGTATQSGANVTVKNAGYNASIPAGGSVSGIGFTANGAATTPSSFAVNGTTCR